MASYTDQITEPQLWASSSVGLSYASALAVDGQANIYVTGVLCGDIYCGGITGSTYSGFTAKYDMNGRLIWSGVYS
ncbi:MAG TPA: hypothetical protein VI750_11705, partial [Pyrinomonadaceae bacterium]|nr:hypothetical protein [Pyrinomonadaceae bacterium]